MAKSIGNVALGMTSKTNRIVNLIPSGSNVPEKDNPLITMHSKLPFTTCPTDSSRLSRHDCITLSVSIFLQTAFSNRFDSS